MRPLLLSLILLLGASLWCALAPTIDQLLIARLLQGIAGAGGAVISAPSPAICMPAMS